MCDRGEDLPCRQRPCQPAPHDRRPTSDDGHDGLKGRPVLYAGVVWIGIVRRFMIPRVCGTPQNSHESATTPPPKTVAHVQAVHPDVHEQPLLKKNNMPVALVTERPKEIPVAPRDAMLRRRERDNKGESPSSPLRAQLHEVSAAATTQVRNLFKELGAMLQDGRDTTADVIEVIRSEDGRNLRLAAISASGLIGYLVGLKRGVVPRLVYSATGATAMATVCYPEDAKTYNHQGLATVRRWIVLGFSFVHSGPQKTLESDRTGISSNTKSDDNKETKSNDNEEDKSNIFSAENIISNLMHNLASFGNRLEDIKDKLQETTGSSTKMANESAKDNITDLGKSSNISDTKTMNSQKSTSNKQADILKSSSLKSDDCVLREVPHGSVPYSPALPVPPEVSSVRSKHKISVVEKEDSLIADPLEETVYITCKRSSEFPSSRSDESSNDSDSDDDDDDNEQQEEGLNDFADTIFVIPTGGLDERMEGKPEYLMKTPHNKNDERPLNKKLVSYYRNIPDEEKTSREKGYDDAYSNRGK